MEGTPPGVIVSGEVISGRFPAKTVSLKLLVDPKSQKVLFAEGGKDFVDFLFNILSFPVGTVIRLLTKKEMVGSLGNLYESIETLSDDYMQKTANKDTLLKPVIGTNDSTVPLLLPHMESSSTSNNLYRCSYSQSITCRNYISYDPRSTCPNCGSAMTLAVILVNPNTAANANPATNEGGYVKGVVTYMVMDDLVVRPMSTISSITLMNKFNIKDIGVLEEKVIDMGMDQGVKLLKAALQSKTVLTDVFLGKKFSK
ncbi:hypothetical protein COLO4_10953 [Corchorus olitorius]|uniref:DUF674 domain-containing protein n=1 Tax=Corchorus olitorius TaxID=93759 RepID=A0A1R3K690_9ROSI|nr:hypothetical protein COLO4_10953 [Corchorus olitorius]